MHSRSLALLVVLLMVGVVWPGLLTTVSASSEWKPEELNWYGISQRRINETRIDASLAALTIDSYLGNLARERARDMAVRGYLSSTTPEGVDVGAYMRKDGVRYETWTEFLADDTTSRPEDEVSWEIINAILNNADKRSVITGSADRLGVGLARVDQRSVFVILIAKVAPPPTPTPVAPSPSGSYTTQQIIDIITAAGRRYGVEPSYLIKIARCESSLNIRAYNPAGPYIGLFQFLPSTFYANGGKDLYNPYDQSDVAARMISRGMARHWGCA